MSSSHSTTASRWHRLKESIATKRATLKDDLIAGLIVAIVALPLAIGFAIASDVPPAMGVYTAVVAGFFAAIFGGSEFQISGPTGAMVVVVLGVVGKYGLDGLVLATLLAGIILLLLGALRFGKIIEYIPSPVIVGFTAGIGFLIFFGQLNNFFGLAPSYPADAGFLTKTLISLGAVVEANFAAVLLAIITLFILILTPRISKRVPGSIVAVTITTLLVVALPTFFVVKTVGDIGTIPQGLPMPHLPSVTWEIIWHILPAALIIATLAAIESLLSAVVADGMTDTKHNPNQELAGQGVANIASAVFGGMPATGAIARTATNIRNGGKSRMAGVFHAVFLLIIILLIAPLAAMIPLAALAGILMFVAFNMVEWERIMVIFHTPLSDVAVMLTTFLLTVLVDLTVAIEVGLVLAALLFMKRMSDLYRVEELEQSGGTNGSSKVVKQFNHPDISIYTVSGPLFFGAASRFDQTVATTPGGHKPIKIIRLKHVPVIDATGLNFLHMTWKKHKKLAGAVYFTSVRPDVMRVIRKSGLEREIGKDHFFPSTRSALLAAIKEAKRRRGKSPTVTEEELKQYNLSLFDLEESARPPLSHDQDPVEEMLDSVGITKIGEIGQETMRKSGKVVLQTVDGALKGTEQALRKTRRRIKHSPVLRKKRR